MATYNLNETKWNASVSAFPPNTIVYADFKTGNHEIIRFFHHVKTTAKGTPMCFELECVIKRAWCGHGDGGATATYVPGERMEGNSGKLRPLPRGAPSYKIYEAEIECWSSF